ncbi:transcriptional regulator PpsR [Polymorphobacter sp.]|uniref:transcriptional regulator PpsR n=1 Tax=Polymorphobacter sp. TaxID=1909290 RepID=UPI003F72E35D
MDVRAHTQDPHSGLLPLSALGPLSVDAAVQALALASDVTLLIDSRGIVRDFALGNPDIADHGVQDWLGRAWTDTVLPENRVKINEMLEGQTPGRWRQVNHPSVSGDLPIRYLAVPAGDDGRLVVIGRDMRAAAALQQRLLRAQQAMERDSLRLRQLEARYRLLFEGTQEAVIIVDTLTRRITEANPAARKMAGLPLDTLEGQPFGALVMPEDRDAAIALLGAAAAAEQRQPTRLRMIGGVSSLVTATLFRQDRGSYLLLRLKPESGRGRDDRPLAEVLDRMPDAFVLTDQRLDILAANGLFLDLVQAARQEDVRGAPLARFIGRPGIDLGVLAAQLKDHGSVRNFATVARADGEAAGRGEEDVELSAVTSEEGDETRYGFSIRRANRVLAAADDSRPLPRSVEQLTELVGRVSLKEIVRESTDLIERLCIEAALTYTSDNRASAAEILGLSRQSLYSKLHRHGLGNLVPGSD